MPCMKDYGKTWSYDGSHLMRDGVFGGVQYIGTIDEDGTPRLTDRWIPFPKYRKIANQYGVCKFVEVQ